MGGEDMAERLTDDQVQQALDVLGGWQREGDRIEARSKHPDFAAALARLNAVAVLAERENHHPDLHLHDWNMLTIRLTTHSEGGITDADLSMARAIDELQ
jgi:4a-hydroxytetrahydrobiopterin dehydratase